MNLKHLTLSLALLFSFSVSAADIKGKLIGQTERRVPYVICGNAGVPAKKISATVTRDLKLYGTFVPARISSQNIAKLAATDQKKGVFNFKAWYTAGAQIVGKVTVTGTTTLSVNFRLYSSQNGAAFFAKRYTAPLKSAQRIGHQIADDVIAAILKEKGFFTSRLLYVKSTGKSKSINICDADGSNQKALSRGNTIATFPAWFPNGRSFLFTSFHEGRPIIYKTNFGDGKVQRMLAMPGMNTSGAVSADGRKLAAILDKDGRPELYVFDIKGGSRVRLTKDRAAESSPSWSPNGSQLVFASDKSGSPQIYIISATGGNARSLTSRSFSNYCTSPAWSPDGKKIAFVAKLGGNYEICFYDFESRQIYRLTNNPSNDEHPDWTRNSRHLAFCRGGSRIVLLDSETGEEATLISSPYKCSNPAWQP